VWSLGILRIALQRAGGLHLSKKDDIKSHGSRLRYLHSQILQPAFNMSPPLPLIAPSSLVDPAYEFVAFNKSMNKWSSEHLLSTRIENAGDDPEKQGKVFADITSAVTQEKLGSKAILPRDARKLIKDLDDDAFKELQEGVNAGIDNHDWTRLASHRTFSLISC